MKNSSMPLSQSSILKVFFRAAGAGLVALGFNFILRFGLLAPFPPESAIESFLRIIPEKIQEPAVQKLGDFAGLLGLSVASVIAIAFYGILGVVFQRSLLPRLAKIRSMSFLEGFLSVLFCSLDYFWIHTFADFWSILLRHHFGVCDVQCNVAFPAFAFVCPTGVLLCDVLRVQGGRNNSKGYVTHLQSLVSSSTVPEIVNSKTADCRRSRASEAAVSRRAFIEKGVLGVGAIALAVTSLDVILSTAFASSGSAPALSNSGTPIDLSGAPAIFSDPRLASLVDAEVTSNDAFYRVAIDLFDPAVGASTYALKVGGLVNQPKTYDLTGFESFFTPVSQYNTFECVSNYINGNLISNAKWTGVKISDLLKDVGGVSPNATYVVFYSVDGYSVGVPLSKAMMSDSILAYKMNDQTLPQKHGFPIRAVIPGLYGMMSAKWINMIEVVDSTYVGYWQTRGWSNDGTVQTVAFINIPGDGNSVSLSKNNGSILLGGVAYAGDRGISKVEVSTDQGKTWQTAQLKKALSNDSWTLWAYEWTLSTGNYSIYARATDGTGALQTKVATDTFPSGATGYAMTSVNVTS